MRPTHALRHAMARTLAITALSLATVGGIGLIVLGTALSSWGVLALGCVLAPVGAWALAACTPGA